MFRKSLMIVALAALVIPYSHQQADAQPDTAWTRYYGGASDDEAYSVQQTTDGGFIIAGCTESFGAGGKDVWLIKTDAWGDTLWAKAYGGTGDDEARSVEQTSDGGYFITGHTASFGAGAADFWFLKTDAQGDTLWTKTYGGGSNEWGTDGRQTRDGGYIIVGTMQSFAIAYDDVWLIKTDSLGDSLWTKNWDININDDRAAEVQQTHDGGFIIVGHTYYTGSGNTLDFTLFKTDSLGNTLWIGTYGERKEQRGVSVHQTSDSGYILTGYTAHSGMANPDVYVVKTDSAGDTTWTKTYGGSEWEEGYLVRQTNEGGYILVGKTNSFGAGGFDVWILKTNSNGDTLWTKTCGGISDDVGYSGQETADGGYIIAGYTASFGAGGRDVYIIRLVYPSPGILSTSPAQNELNVPVSTNISVTFDVDMDEATINDTTFVVNARLTGLHLGTITYDGPSKTATFDPTEDFDDGEAVTVVLTTGIQSSQGTPLNSSYCWCFTLVVDGGSGTFAPHVNYAVGDGPSWVFGADLDEDGDLDLAVANEYSATVSVLLGQGDGDFVPDSVYPVTGYAKSVFAADLDWDGDLDLVTANTASNVVSVLLNNGDATFASHSVYPVGAGPFSVFAADLDGDGDLDLATANVYADNISVLLNDGDGTFSPHSVYSTGIEPHSVFAADLDGDGDLDLATANWYSYSISILFNNGDGTFGTYSDYPVGNNPKSVFAADLDGDGDLDLATANWVSDNVSVLLNYGDGTFAPHSVYPVGHNPGSVFSADFDGDGDLDLATANYDVHSVSVLWNNGDGAFVDHSAYSTGGYPWSVFAADFDGDGDQDIATANRSNTASVLLNWSKPHVVCTSPTTNELNAQLQTNILVTFDIDMDETTINDTTFVVNARSTGLHPGTITYDAPTRTVTFDPSEDFEEGEVVSVVLTSGIESSDGLPMDYGYCWSFTSEVQGGLGAFLPDSAYPAGDHPYSVFSADLDGDGDLDLATANAGSDNVSVLLNNGDGTFAPHSVYTVGDYPRSVFSADLDGDGDLDLTTANSNSDNVSVLLNNGDGTFAPHSVYAVGDRPRSVFSADLNGDGNLDLAVANYYSHNVSVLLNNGDGTFASHLVYPVGTYPRSVFSADLDGDGDLDLATANYTSHNVSVLLNNGDGTFASSSSYPASNFFFGPPYSVIAADLDGDGDLDLATANAEEYEYRGSVLILLNNGDGTYAPFSSLFEQHFSGFHWVCAADLDGDADLDLAAANYFFGNVLVLLNNGDATFGPHSVYPTGESPISVFSADLDGDGDLDLATANRHSDNVSVLLNASRGDANGDGIINVGDIVYLVSYLYKNGPAPSPIEAGDANCDGIVNLGDIVYLVSYLYKNGPPPGCP